MMPTRRPANACFSSGPCAKRPGWTPAALSGALVGRSHRSPVGLAQCVEVIDRSRDALLTMPARGTLKAAREFAERHADWIGVRLARLPKPIAFAPGETVPLRGVEHLIVHRPNTRGVVWLEAGVLCVAGEPAQRVGQRGRQVDGQRAALVAQRGVVSRQPY